MPKKSSNSRSSASKSASRKSAPAATVSRNTPVPRSATKREVTHEMVAKRAYEIFISGKGTDQLGNWLRAERELRTL